MSLEYLILNVNEWQIRQKHPYKQETRFVLE